MPVSFRTDTGGITLLVWKITESEQELRALVGEEDTASADKIANRKRRTEHLAWRAALRAAGVSAEVRYDDRCAPYLVNDHRHISAAHTTGAAAVVISDKPCAVDIEQTGRDFSRTYKRFCSERELALPQSGHKLFRSSVWSAKEALYKYSGRDGLDFKKDIEIVSADIDNGNITGRITKPNMAGINREIHLKLTVHDGYAVIYIV